MVRISVRTLHDSVNKTTYKIQDLKNKYISAVSNVSIKVSKKKQYWDFLATSSTFPSTYLPKSVPLLSWTPYQWVLSGFFVKQTSHTLPCLLLCKYSYVFFSRHWNFLQCTEKFPFISRLSWNSILWHSNFCAFLFYYSGWFLIFLELFIC